MAPVGRRTDKQWRFVGQEVKDVSDLTMTHIRSVYGLSSEPKLKGVSSSDAQGMQENIDSSIFPYCVDRFSDFSSNKQSSKGSGSSTCSAIRCKDNPHCLNYMGQDQWEKEDAFEMYFEAVNEKSDPELSKRKENTPAGMKNLGATCYANSLLQVWFHDLAFRDVIYKCDFDMDTDKAMNALYHLQLLFAHLDRGARNVYNPLSLVFSLKLDTNIQQDAQEFCNLFMARIDNQLQAQKDARLRAFVKSQFQGKYSYNTTCKNCKTTSARDCSFYELMLNIKDNCTLMDCFEEFVEPELLVGADRYACSKCQSLQDASREIKFQRLPPVLNIQLMRFVYDSATWSRMKSKDTIRFPQSIDLSSLLQSKERVIYELSAVLVHSGPSAHSGHFLAHVLEKQSQKWFVLNDEGVAEFSSTIFDPEEYSSADSKAKAKGTAMKPGDTAGNFLNNLSSRNAYMLTYTKKADISAAEPYAPPAAMLEIVNRDNAAFSVDLKHYAEHQDKIRKDFELARRIRRDIYQCWHVDGEQDAGCYVSAEALAGFMQLNSKADKRQTGTSQTAFAIDNTGIVCEHGKICPTAVTKSKRISESARLLLESREHIKIDPLLTTDDICVLCTRNIFQDKLYNITHRRDVEEFERKLKGVRSPLAAWVSKRWISEWTKMSPRFHPTHGTVTDDPTPLSDAYLSDVFCPHSGLSSDKNTRRLINQAALEVLTRVFGTLHLPEADMDECEECHIQLQPELESKKDMLARAATEKSELADLFMIGTKLRQMEPEVKYNVISHDFLKQWLDFVKKPTINPRPASLDNKGLLCQHGQFMFDLDNAVDVENDKGIAIVKDEEWVHLQELYGGGPEVIATRTQAAGVDGGQKTGSTFTKSIPSVCQTCRNERVLDFSSTTLTVRVYSASSTGANSRGVLVQSNDESEAAALASQPSSSPSMGSSSKRKNGAAPSSVQNGMRRSKRAKATKSPFKQIKVLVSKWDTVMDLKLKIMEKANIVPLYQKLLYEQTEFDKNDKTIGDLKIPPNAVLTLIEYDETMDEQLLENLQDERPPGDELGFGGTGLAAGWLG